MSGSRKVRPNSFSSWGRASRQASAVVTGLPSTAWLVTDVSSAVATMVPRRLISRMTTELSSVTPRAWVSSSSEALESLRAAVPAESLRTKPWSRMTAICVTTATASEMPRTVRQCVRMVETAPSRISPTPSGRSGITPGLAAGGGPPHCPPQPPGLPWPGVPRLP